MFDLSHDRLLVVSMRDVQRQIAQEEQARRTGSEAPDFSIDPAGPGVDLAGWPGIMLESALDFLDDRRQTGGINHPVALLWDLSSEFSLTPWDAVCILAFWLETYDALHPDGGA